MIEEPLMGDIKRLIFDYVRSPSLRHIRDPYSVDRLATDILKCLTARNPVWTKWSPQREALVEAASLCWIPVTPFREYLNAMEGPPLTNTDVAQRMRAFHEEAYHAYPNPDLQADCVALFEAETAQGTEMPAIIGALQEFVEDQEQRLLEARQLKWRKRAEDERQALERQFLSGADCKWTPVSGAPGVYCRMNGRAFQALQGKDKVWVVFRIKDVGETSGQQIGRYKNRGDATKVLTKMAYEPEI